jgi:hypothetical protein
VGVSDFLHNPYIIIPTCTYSHSLSNLFQMDPRINMEAFKVTSNSLTVKVFMPTKHTAKALILPLLSNNPTVLNNMECLNNNIMVDNPCISSNNPIRLSLRMVVSPCPQPCLLGEQPPVLMGKFTTTTPLRTKPAGINPLECLELPHAVLTIDRIVCEWTSIVVKPCQFFLWLVDD